MNKLEYYIINRNDQFDLYEPPKGHEDRFRQKLLALKPKPRINLMMVAAAASIAGFVLTASLSLLFNYNQIVQTLRGQNIAHSEQLYETTRIEQYYNRLLIQKKQLIYSIIPNSDHPLRLEASRVFLETEQGYYNLKVDLQQLAENERAVYVITQFYQIQVSVLDDLIIRIIEAKNSTQAFKSN